MVGAGAGTGVAPVQPSVTAVHCLVVRDREAKDGGVALARALREYPGGLFVHQGALRGADVVTRRIGGEVQVLAGVEVEELVALAPLFRAFRRGFHAFQLPDGRDAGVGRRADGAAQHVACVLRHAP